MGELPSDAPSVTGTRVLQQHFPTGLIGPTTALIRNPHIDFRSEQGQAVVKKVTDELAARKDELHIADIRSLTAPLGTTEAGAHALEGLDAGPKLRPDLWRRS